ncbi:MAG: hypothetical protein GY952_06800, partial [Rhodobacteraceae bacterium]|nr:hypothetical protein [Paracoccaceae bacterium]
MGVSVTVGAGSGQSVSIGEPPNVSDGDKGDITVASGGTVWTLDDGVVDTKIEDADAKLTPADADIFALLDSAASFVLTGSTWANIKATLTANGFLSNVVDDSQFRISDTADPTKLIAFEADQITTGNTRTVTMADVDVDLADVNTALQNLVEDTTPQLGGDLDGQATHDIQDVPNVAIGGTTKSRPLHVSGSARIGANDASAVVLEVGAGATGNRQSRLDLVGDTTYSTYGFRILRNSGGPNTSTDILHRGIGALDIIAVEAADINLATTNLTRLKVDSGGDVSVGTTSAEALFHVEGHAIFEQDVNTQSDDYTGISSDKNKCIRMTKATANTFTIPANASVAY